MKGAKNYRARRKREQLLGSFAPSESEAIENTMAASGFGHPINPIKRLVPAKCQV